MNQRLRRVAGEIKKEIGRIIHNDLNDPRVGFITITKVDLSADLHFAKIHFSLLGTEKQLRDTQVGLARSAGFVRKLLAQRIRLRHTPELVFKLDEGTEHSIRISEVLEKIKNKEKANERTKST